MVGRSSQDQGQLFYSFNLDEIFPDDHLVRTVPGVLDLTWVVVPSGPNR
jgi:hypothetical protein